MYLKVSPMRGVHRFGIHGKLGPRYFICGTQCVSCIVIEEMFAVPNEAVEIEGLPL